MKKKIVIICIIILFALILGIIGIKIVPNYSTKNYAYIKGKVNIVINNNNVTKKLKHDMYVNEKNVIYMSKDDIANFLDNYIYLDEDNNQIITTYGEKVGVLSIDKKMMYINDSLVELLSGAEEKDGTYYLPISSMSKIYNMDIDYIESNNIITLDSLDKALTKADITKNVNVKIKTAIFSKTVDKIKKGEKIIIIEKLNNNWTKIRTKNGYVGYIKSNIIDNEISVRTELENQNINQKINMVWDYYSEFVKAPSRKDTNIDGLNVISPAFFTLVSKGDGRINSNVGNEGLEYIEWAKQNNYQIWALFSNNSYKETTHNLLSTYDNRNKLINNILKLAIQYEVDGINLDFENLNAEDKEVYSRFIIELKPRLQEAGIILSVDVTAPDGGSDWSECFDRAIIGDVADYIIFMAYDQYGESSKTAGTTAGFNWVETNLKKFINREEIDSNKIILGIPFYTRLWIEEGSNVSSKVVNMKNIDNVLPSNITKEWKDDVKQYYVEYEKFGKVYKMWIEDEKSIQEKVSLVNTYNLAGVAAWAKDRESQNIWKIINNELKK